jgi:hypothetical protein
MTFVDCLLLFFLWIVSTCVLICLVLLLDGFPSLILIHGVFLHFTLGVKAEIERKKNSSCPSTNKC